MHKFMVRRPYGPGEWDDADAREVRASNAQYAAVEFAEQQCARDPECYRAYESGVFLEVMLAESREIVDVAVTVEFNPHFRGVQQAGPIRRAPTVSGDA